MQLKIKKGESLRYFITIGLALSSHFTLVTQPWKSVNAEYFIPTPKKFKLSKNRSTSFPYISTDSFRAICDHVCDETDAIFVPKNVQYGDTIYLTTYSVKDFYKQIHPKIKTSYILVTGYGDSSNPSAALNYLKDPKLLAWFGTNCDIKLDTNSKFIPIPIGLANNFWQHGNTKIMTNIQNKITTISKQYLLGLNFIIKTNTEERNLAYNTFSNKKFCTILLNKLDKKHISYQDYLNNMAQCKFIISPHGNGLDCYRTWEALLVGTIPIVKKSTLDPLYDNLPVIIVDKWSDVTQKFLEEKYQQINFNDYNLNKCYFKYWEDLIKKTQHNFRAIK